MNSINPNSNIPIQGQKRKLGDITNTASNTGSNKIYKTVPKTVPKTVSKTASKARIIHSHEQNLAASVSEVKDLPDGIREHAHLRIQMFYAVAIQVLGVAKRTNGDVTDIKVWVGRATKQDGQGTREEHAAHSNAAAGLSDDLKENYIKQIIDDGITPVKAGVLSRIRNLSADELIELHENHTDEEFVQDVIDRVWPGNSAISGTELEDQINATDRLPRSLNLGCDLLLEKSIRPYIAELMTRVMKGEIEPREATDLYVKAIQDHFASKLEEIGGKIEILKKEDKKDTFAIEKLEKQQLFHQTQMNGTNPLDYDLIDGPKKKLQF